MADDCDPTAVHPGLPREGEAGCPPPRGDDGARLPRRSVLAAGGTALAVLALPLPPGRAQAHELLASAAPIDEIRIVKGARTMDLVRDGEVVGSYRIALGFAPEGDKERRGDGRTPEGRYTIIALNRYSQFHLSLRLDYPNAEDRARAAAAGVDPGSDIMIHGLAAENRHLGPLASYKDWTEGCVAVSNEEIEEIVAMTPIGTPVVITP